MKFKAELVLNKKGVITLDCGYNIELPKSDFYTVEIKPYKSSRSLEQNNLLWQTITEIANISNDDMWNIYVRGLIHCNCKYEYIATLPDAEHTLAKTFRAYKPVGTTTTDKGVELTTYKVWYGSSKMDTKEMTDLIDFFSEWLEDLKRNGNDIGC